MSRRLLLIALCLLLAVPLAWILRGHNPGPSSGVQGTAIHSTAVAGGGPQALSDISRNDVRTDQGRTEPAAAPDAAGGWVLRGSVWDEFGEPLTGVTVRLVSGVSSSLGDEEPRYYISGRPAFASARTGADGRFHIRLPSSPIPAKTSWWTEMPGLLCDSRDGSPTLKCLPVSFHAHGGVCDLVVRGGFGLTGRVLSRDGAPAAHCVLHFKDTVTVWSADEAGRFRAPLPSGRFELRLDHTLGVLRMPDLLAAAGEDLDLGDLTLLGAGQLSGRLILPDGSPAPQVRLSFTARTKLENRDGEPSDNWSDEGRLEAWTVTDAAGAFRVQGLTLDDHAPLCHAMGAAIPLHPQGAPPEDTSWLRAGSESAGHLLVLPWRMLLLEVPEFEVGMNTLMYEVHGSAAAGADPPAIATFRHLTTGFANAGDLPLVLLYDSATWIRVTAVAGTEASSSALFPVAPDPWLTRAALPLDPFGSTGRILVRATDAAGEPVQNLKLELKDPRTGLAVLGAWQSRADGGAEIRNAPAGVWSLVLRSDSKDSDNYALPEVIHVEVRGNDTRELDWRPRTGGRLQVIVNIDNSPELPANPPALSAMVVSGPDHVGNLLNLVEDGKQRQRAPRTSFMPATVMVVAGVLEPGSYRIRFTAEGYAPTEATVDVLPADIARLVASISSAP